MSVDINRVPSLKYETGGLKSSVLGIFEDHDGLHITQENDVPAYVLYIEHWQRRLSKGRLPGLSEGQVIPVPLRV